MEKRNVIKSILIPKCEGRSFVVKRNQILRVVEAEGPQAADLIAFNLTDLRESSSTWLTRQLSGSFTKLQALYSKLPAGNLMFRILTDIPHVFWLSPGRCNKLYYRLKYGIEQYHKNCQDILVECMKTYGIGEYDIPEVFNIFMDAKF